MQKCVHRSKVEIKRKKKSIIPPPLSNLPIYAPVAGFDMLYTILYNIFRHLNEPSITLSHLPDLSRQREPKFIVDSLLVEFEVNFVLGFIPFEGREI